MGFAFVEGFETAQSIALLQEGWTFASFSGLPTFPTGRKLGVGFQSDVDSNLATYAIGGAADTWTISFGLKYDGGDVDLLGFHDFDFVPANQTSRIRLIEDAANGEFLFELFDPQSGASGDKIKQSPGLPVGVWHHIEMKIFFSATVGYWHVRANGQTLLEFDATGIDLTGGGGGDPVTFYFFLGRDNAADTFVLDDIVIQTNAGGSSGVAEEYLGDVVVGAAFPITDVATGYNAGGFADVDNLPTDTTPDSDKATATVVGQENTYTLGPVGQFKSDVKAVELRVRMIGESGAASGTQNASHDGNSVGTKKAFNGFTEELNVILTTVPVVGDTWSLAELEKPFGHKLTAST